MVTTSARGLFLLLAIALWQPVVAIDPMAPPSYRGGKTGAELVRSQQSTMPLQPSRRDEFVVQQVVIKGDHKSAVINDELVEEGEKFGEFVGGAYVTSISVNAVVIRVNGEQKILPVRDDYPNVTTRSQSKN